MRSLFGHFLNFVGVFFVELISDMFYVFKTKRVSLVSNLVVFDVFVVLSGSIPRCARKTFWFVGPVALVLYPAKSYESLSQISLSLLVCVHL